MQSTTYTLNSRDDFDEIVHDLSGLKIKVFSLRTAGFSANPVEIHYFADDAGEWLVFETIGYHDHDLTIVDGAIVWYARYLDNTDLQILEGDPRPPNHLKVIR